MFRGKATIIALDVEEVADPVLAPECVVDAERGHDGPSYDECVEQRTSPHVLCEIIHFTSQVNGYRHPEHILIRRLEVAEESTVKARSGENIIDEAA